VLQIQPKFTDFVYQGQSAHQHCQNWALKQNPISLVTFWKDLKKN